MSRILLVTNPSDDKPTEYLDAWSEQFINLAVGQKNTVVFELRRNQANRGKLTQLIENEKPRLVVFNGHGSDDSIAGFGQEILIRCDENEHLLRGKIVHTLACHSGKTLGPKCIQIGTLAYVGYKEAFKFVHLNKISKKEQFRDEMARFFLQPAYEAVIALIEGATVGEAYDRSQKTGSDLLITLLASESTAYNTTVASRLFHNLTHQVCLGNKGASF